MHPGHSAEFDADIALQIVRARPVRRIECLSASALVLAVWAAARCDVAESQSGRLHLHPTETDVRRMEPRNEKGRDAVQERPTQENEGDEVPPTVTRPKVSGQQMPLHDSNAPEVLAPESQALTEQRPADATLMFERLASDPNVDVAKLEKLIEMQERIMRHQAKAAFDAAFSEMQGEIPVITERGEIIVKGELRSKYATNEDIQQVVKPILQRHGFALRFRNEFDGGKLKVIGILSHRSGHSEHDEFVAAADDSGSKNAIQALGSTRSYGQRYTTTALLNIATRGADDDGQTSEQHKQPEAPAGFDDWLTDMAAVAEDGWDALKACFNKSKEEYRNHLTVRNTAAWEALKKKAAAKKKAVEK